MMAPQDQRAHATATHLGVVEGGAIVTELLRPTKEGASATIVLGGRPFHVRDLSAVGLCIDTADGAPADAVVPAELRLADQSHVSVFTVRLKHAWSDDATGRSGWTFVDPDHQLLAEIEAFRGDVAAPPPAAPAPVIDVPARRGSAGKILRYVLFGTTAAVLVGYAALSAFETFFTVHSSFAAVTAPAVQVKAAEGGALALDGLAPGMHVDRGQRLGRILNPDLEADLGIETTRLDSTKALIAELESAVKAQPAATAASSEPSGVVPVASFDFSQVPVVPGASYREDVLRELSPMMSSIFDGVDLGSPEAETAGLTTEAVALDTQRRISELKAALGVQQQRVTALQSAVAALEVVSPCDCTVYAIAVADGDTWIDRGGQIAELVQTGGSDMRIEARVPVRIVDRLRPGQEVRIDLPDGRASVGGTLESVVLGGEEMPRAGFPDWIREDRAEVSLIIAPAEPLDPALVGTAVEARIYLDPDWSLFDEVLSALGFGSRSDMDRPETAPSRPIAPSGASQGQEGQGQEGAPAATDAALPAAPAAAPGATPGTVAPASGTQAGAAAPAAQEPLGTTIVPTAPEPAPAAGEAGTEAAAPAEGGSVPADATPPAAAGPALTSPEEGWIPSVPPASATGDGQ